MNLQSLLVYYILVQVDACQSFLLEVLCTASFLALSIPLVYHLTLLIDSSIFPGLPRLAQSYLTEGVVKGSSSLCSHDKVVTVGKETS